MRYIQLLASILLLIMLCVSCVKKVYITDPPEDEICATPVFSPPAGAYPHVYLNGTMYEGYMVGGASIYCETAGATIRYTIDGSIPDSTSNIYEDTIHFYLHHKTVTIRAKAYKDGFRESLLASATYTDNGVNGK
jgi:chitinase